MLAFWWTTAGLVITAFGVVLLYRYGMPFRVRTAGESALLLEGLDTEALRIEARFAKLGWLGLALIILGTVAQIAGAYLSV